MKSMNLKFDCFFCEDAIRGEKVMDSGRPIGMPSEPGVLTLSFMPTYERRLVEEMREAETEFERGLIKQTVRVNKVLQEANRYIGIEGVTKTTWLGGGTQLPNGSMIYGFEFRNNYMGSEKTRFENALHIYMLDLVSYRIPGVSMRPKGFKSHSECVERSLELEDVATNPLVRPQFREDMTLLPKPYRDIYENISGERVNVRAAS